MLSGYRVQTAFINIKQSIAISTAYMSRPERARLFAVPSRRMALAMISVESSTIFVL